MLCTSPLIRTHLSFDSSSVFVSVSVDPVQRHALAISFHVTRIVLSPFRLSPALTVCLCILLTVYIVVQAYTQCVLWSHARVFPLCATFIYPIKSRHHYYSTRLFTTVQYGTRTVLLYSAVHFFSVAYLSPRSPFSKIFQQKGRNHKKKDAIHNGNRSL